MIGNSSSSKHFLFFHSKTHSTQLCNQKMIGHNVQHCAEDTPQQQDLSGAPPNQLIISLKSLEAPFAIAMMVSKRYY